MYGWRVQFPVWRITNLKGNAMYAFIGLKSYFLFEKWLLF